jgi:hypothetical protein
VSGAHEKLIAKAAKTILQPLGLRRKGQSRLWIGDHGWWLAVVEFQPSGFAEGSYLNVAAHWLWSDNGYISFDLGGGAEGGSRVAGFEAFESDEQFEGTALRLAAVAAQEVCELTARLPSIAETANLLLSKEAKSPARGSWSTYHAGVAAGLAGRAGEANAMLRSVTDTRVKGAATGNLELSSAQSASGRSLSRASQVSEQRFVYQPQARSCSKVRSGSRTAGDPCAETGR